MKTSELGIFDAVALAAIMGFFEDSAVFAVGVDEVDVVDVLDVSFFKTVIEAAHAFGQSVSLGKGAAFLFAVAVISRKQFQIVNLEFHRHTAIHDITISHCTGYGDLYV